MTDSVAGTAVLSAGSNNATTTFSGTLQNGAGTLALTKSGTGTLTLSGTNTYSGATTVSAGTLRAGSGSALSATSDFTVSSILDLNGFSNSDWFTGRQRHSNQYRRRGDIERRRR